MDWFYIDSNRQEVGPISESALRSSGATAETFVWNCSLANWTQLALIPNCTWSKDVEARTHKFEAKDAINPLINNDDVEINVTDELEVMESDEPARWIELFTLDGDAYYFDTISKSTQWEKPDALKSFKERDRTGDWYWITSEEESFLPARLVATLPGGKIRVELENGRQLEMKRPAEFHGLQLSHLSQDVEDLVMLDDLNTPLILHSLKKRFWKDQIYTNVGTILISINPYKSLGLYTPSIMEKYRSRGISNLPPHIFVIADNAYEKLIDLNLNQSIIISGESGAGKTEATKQCLQYFADCAGSHCSVEQKILLANPILESFGNAKTVRNNNSSRFGKYIEIFFNHNHQIVGARNTSYLLEKVRVVVQTGIERNYHIFYQLCAGASREQRHLFGLSDASDFHYLNQAEQLVIPGVDDAQEFQELQTALQQLEISTTEIHDIFSTTSGVLHLGNVLFKDIGERICHIDSDITMVSRLLGVSQRDLQRALTERSLIIRDEKTTIYMSASEASDNRDALAKHVYDVLFNWLVQRINSSITTQGIKKKLRTVGVLDIFGFEIFQVNSFEQLCINFTNEKLQQYFNMQTFLLEEQLYQFERIEFVSVPYIDNQPILDLIENRTNGILRMLDEELRFPRSTDLTFITRMHSLHKLTPQYAEVRKCPTNFVLKHYAGDVEYTGTGFLEKNRDTLSQDLLDLLSTSKLPFLKQLAKVSGKDRKKSLGHQFSIQLDQLMSTLDTTEPHYVRCIKPNENKSPGEFNSPMILEQLTNSGVFEAVKIRKSGFPFRYTHEMFCRRFKAVLPKLRLNNFKDCASKLITAMGADLDAIQIGRSKVLYRAEQHRYMELKRNVALSTVAEYIQKYWRGAICRKLRREWVYHQPGIVSAIQKRQLDLLNYALETVQHLKFPFKELSDARDLRNLLLKEKDCNDRLTYLIRNNPEENFEALSQAVAAADDLNISSSITEQARVFLSEVLARRKCVHRLRDGIQLYDRSVLEMEMANALRMGLDVQQGKLLSEATCVLEHIYAEDSVINTLEYECSVNGYYSPGDIPGIYDLGVAVEHSEEFGMKTDRGVYMRELGKTLISLRQLIVCALETGDSSLWGPVEDLITSSQSEFGSHHEITVAKECVATLAAKTDVEARLHAAIESCNEHELTIALQAVDTLKMCPEEFPIIYNAKDWLASISQCNLLVQEASEIVDEDSLIYAVEYADLIGISTNAIEACRCLRDNVVRLNASANDQLNLFEPDIMRTIVEDAENIRLSTPAIEKLSELLYRTSEEKFLELQLEAAKSHGQLSRVISLTIKSKELFFLKMKSTFDIRKSPELLLPREYAESKFFGLHLNKDKLALGFLKHTCTPIHTCLTRELSSEENKLGKRIFKSLLCFMGDRQNTTDGLILAQEMLVVILGNPELWTEVYCQIIKQLTENPSETSRDLGWGLLDIFLDTFPCGKGMENYLEYWLRTKSPTPDQHVRRFHQTMYGGARVSVPSTVMLRMTMAGKSDRDAEDGIVANTFSELSHNLSQKFGNSEFRRTKDFLIGEEHLKPVDQNGGWCQYSDEVSGEFYYFNEESGLTTWDPPCGTSWAL